MEVLAAQCSTLWWHLGCLVRSVKKVLKGLMDAHEVSSDVFETLVVRAEGILNLRPLTAASTSPDDFKPLTPNDIPYPGMLLTLPLEILPPATEPTPSILLKCWQQVCALADGYWRRRQREYISLLQSCVKWMRETKYQSQRSCSCRRIHAATRMASRACY